MADLLDDQWSVLIYPEGTRSLTGEMAYFKPGIGLIATEMLAPVIPVKLEGLYDILPKGKLWPRRGKVGVNFGKPLFFKGERNYASVAKKIEQSIRDLDAPERN